jgi:hypothetical protein
MVDAKYVAQCVDYIRNNENRPLVRPVFETDMNKLPSIVVASYQGESQNFLGDYGMEHLAQSKIDPVVITTFDAIRIEEGVVTTTDNQNVYETVWPGLYFRSGDVFSKINRIAQEEGVVRLYLDSSAPVGTTLKGCQITTSCDQKWYSLNSSVDTVKVSITLTTHGDHAIHRLMTVLLRYCLKSGRMLFEQHGMQVATFSQQPAVVADESQLIWQTQFTADAKITDHWIESEGGLIMAPMKLETEAVRVGGSPEETVDWE